MASQFASSFGASQNNTKMAQPKAALKNQIQNKSQQTRKPLQAIDANVAATRVQPSREAKRKQKAFNIFVDHGNKSQSVQNVKQKAVVSKVDEELREEAFETALASAAAIPSFNVFSSASTSVENRQQDETIDLLSSPVAMDMSQLEKSLPLNEDSGNGKVMEELYAEDIYSYFLEREKKNAPKPRYMAKQTDINHRMRTILIDWLIEVSEEMQLSQETLYITVNLIDRFLSKMSVLRGKLQLVGGAALLIASKYEEIYPPAAKDIIYLTDDCYTVQQLFRMEDLILKVLDYDVSAPTPNSFLVQINKFAESDEVTEMMSIYIVELAVMQGDFYLSHSPSHLSASAVCLARHTLGYLPWSDELTDQTSYGEDDLRDCVRQLTDLLCASANTQKSGVSEKYSQVKYREVAFFNPPASYPL